MGMLVELYLLMIWLLLLFFYFYLLFFLRSVLQPLHL